MLEHNPTLIKLLLIKKKIKKNFCLDKSILRVNAIFPQSIELDTEDAKNWRLEKGKIYILLLQ